MRRWNNVKLNILSVVVDGEMTCLCVAQRSDVVDQEHDGIGFI